MKDFLLYTYDAADDMQCVYLGGRRIIKKTFNDEIDALMLLAYFVESLVSVSYTHLRAHET